MGRGRGARNGGRRTALSAMALTVLALAGTQVLAMGVAAALPASITGTVTDTNGVPLAGICVSAVANGFDAGTVTASDGTYSLAASISAEIVTVGFRAGPECASNTGNYAQQFYSGASTPGQATAVTITPGQTVTGVDAVMVPGGSITGTVTDASTAGALGGICVMVTPVGGSTYTLVATGADGTYDVDGLSSDDYDVVYYDEGTCPNQSPYQTQWYDDAPSASAADPVVVTAGQVTGAVDASLTPDSGPAATVTTLTASPPTSAFGQLVTYSASVSAPVGVPTGQVAITVGTTPLCTVALFDGQGSCPSAAAPAGDDTVTGTYVGDAQHPGSVGTTSELVAASAPAVPTPPPPTTPAATAPSSGYDLVGSDGGVFVFGAGPAQGFYGSLPGDGVHVDDICGMVTSPDDRGYFLVGSDGGVFAFGDAPYLGSLPGLHVSVDDIRGIVPTSDDRGYFLVGSDGGVFAFGDAPYLGSLPGSGIHVGDIIGIAATPSDHGYWLVAANGTVYAFGDARSFGSALGTPSPVSAITSTPDGGGYWIVTRAGGVYPFGDAVSFGSLPSLHVTPAHPVIGLVPVDGDQGYWLIGADGGIFAFGRAPFVGSLPGLGVHVTDVVGAVPTI